MKIILRGLQFLITGICMLIEMILYIYNMLFIGLTGIAMFIVVIAALFGSDGWNIFWKLLFYIFQLFVAIFILHFMTYKVGDVFGIFLNEKRENEEIFQKYEEWFFRWYEKNDYNSRQTGYHQEKYSKDNIVEKYEEYLKFFGIDVNSEISSIKIKKAYKEKMKKVHPDKNHGKDTTAETAKVNEIKEFLDMNLEYYLMKRRKNGY